MHYEDLSEGVRLGSSVDNVEHGSKTGSPVLVDYEL